MMARPKSNHIQVAYAPDAAAANTALAAKAAARPFPVASPRAEPEAPDNIREVSRGSGPRVPAEVVNLDQAAPAATMKGHKVPNSQPMRTYTFRVVVEPDEDRWHAYCPALEQYGAATWGATREEALKHIHEVIEMVIEELAEDGVPIPEGPKEEVEVSSDARVAVTVP